MVYDGAVYIPDSINGFALTVLNYPYFGMGYMREVRLPETLTYLYGDFGSNLRSFNIPKNLYYFVSIRSATYCKSKKNPQAGIARLGSWNFLSCSGISWN